jgi:Uma2 family endonuclease
MQPLAQHHVTPEEYLALERASEFRSELIDGQIVAMSGTSRAHSLIVVNLAREISVQLRGRPCEIYIADMRVRVAPTGLYTYPDLAGLCGEPRLEDGHHDTLTNPALVIEVLSPSTEAYDRGEKFAQYRALDSLCEYVLVAQDRMRVEHYRRQEAQWVLTALDGPDAVLNLESIGCTVRLADIYEKVELG